MWRIGHVEFDGRSAPRTPSGHFYYYYGDSARTVTFNGYPVLWDANITTNRVIVAGLPETYGTWVTLHNTTNEDR